MEFPLYGNVHVVLQPHKVRGQAGYNCATCNMWFKGEWGAKLHFVAKHLAEKPRNFPCVAEDCGKLYPNPSARNYHYVQTAHGKLNNLNRC